MAEKPPVHRRSDTLQFIAIILAPTLVGAAAGFGIPLLLGGEVALALMTGMALGALGMLFGVFWAVRVQSSET